MAAAKNTKKEKKPIMSCASSRHITKLKQSIFAPFDIYGSGCNNFCQTVKSKIIPKKLLKNSSRVIKSRFFKVDFKVDKNFDFFFRKKRNPANSFAQSFSSNK
jgi:hypothetical protein